ncbi:unnamed protein product [Linum tenue]|uniref:Cytochrome P450 n=1 Tax=Linum tenue TaxID=586396 RepID=A0AAV0N8S8_9ROSI|nr:unnamed protein product [Linum tenue]
MPIMITILLLAFLFFVSLWLSIVAFIAKKKSSSSSAVEWPVVGMLPALLCNATTNLHGFITRLVKESGGTFLFKGPCFANLDFVVTSDPMNAHHVFSKNFANYGKGEDFKAMFEELFGEGIVNSDGESWRFQRQRIHSFLTKDGFENYVMRTLHQKMEGTLFRVLDDACSTRRLGTVHVEVDMQDVVSRFMFDNICMWVLGFDPGYLCVDRQLSTFSCGKAFDEIEEAVIYRHIVPRSIWEFQKRFGIGSEKKISQSTKVLDEFLYDVVKTKKQELHKEEQHQQLDLLTQWLEQGQQLDMLTQLMIAGQKGESSDKSLRDMVFTLIAAGKDTLSSTLSWLLWLGKDSVSSVLTWLLWLVVIHPRVEKKIIEEIERVVVMAKRRPDPREGRLLGVFMIDKDEMNRLVYLHAIICETLRLYPPAPFELRCAIEDDMLPSGHLIHKGTRILFSIYSMGRMEEIWGKDCMEFKPERWISEQGSLIHIPSYKFINFLAGPRYCLGKSLSFMQLKFIVSTLLWNYKFDMAEEGHVVKSTPSMVLSMKDGLKMRVSKRNV